MQVLLGKFQVGARHIVGHLEQGRAELLASVYLLQLPPQAGQVGTEGGIGRELGIVRCLASRLFATVLLVVAVGRIFLAYLVILGCTHEPAQHFNLRLLANTIQEFSLTIGNGLGDVAHSLGQRLVGIGGSLGTGGESCPARGVGFAIPAQRLGGLIFQALRHFVQPLDGALALVVLESIAAGLHHLLGRRRVTGHQFAEGNRGVLAAELPAWDGAIAAIAAVVAAHALGLGHQRLELVRRHAALQRELPQIMPVLGVLGLDDLRGTDGFAGGGYGGLLLVCPGLALGARLLAGQFVKPGALFRRQRHADLLIGGAVAHLLGLSVHETAEIFQGLRVGHA